MQLKTITIHYDKNMIKEVDGALAAHKKGTLMRTLVKLRVKDSGNVFYKKWHPEAET